MTRRAPPPEYRRRLGRRRAGPGRKKKNKALKKRVTRLPTRCSLLWLKIVDTHTTVVYRLGCEIPASPSIVAATSMMAVYSLATDLYFWGALVNAVCMVGYAVSDGLLKWLTAHPVAYVALFEAVVWINVAGNLCSLTSSLQAAGWRALDGSVAPDLFNTAASIVYASVAILYQRQIYVNATAGTDAITNTVLGVAFASYCLWMAQAILQFRCWAVTVAEEEQTNVAKKVTTSATTSDGGHGIGAVTILEKPAPSPPAPLSIFGLMWRDRYDSNFLQNVFNVVPGVIYMVSSTAGLVLNNTLYEQDQMGTGEPTASARGYEPVLNIAALQVTAETYVVGDLLYVVGAGFCLWYAVRQNWENAAAAVAAAGEATAGGVSSKSSGGAAGNATSSACGGASDRGNSGVLSVPICDDDGLGETADLRSDTAA